MDPAVSVVIPAYNVARYLAEAIDSVLVQTLREFEIIVVNDGCPNSAAMEAVLAPYIAAGKISYVRQENRGLAGARNTGIRAAKGELVAVLDGDDRYRPEALEVWAGIMRSNTATGLVYGNGMFFGGTERDGQDLMTNYPSPDRVVTFTDLVTRKANSVGCAMFRRDRLFEIGLYDERLRKAEDYDIALRMAKSGAVVENTKTIVFDYRLRPDGLSQSGGDLRAWRIRVLEKQQKQSDLTPAETEILAGELRYQHAMQALDDSRVALRSGDYARARSRFRDANPPDVNPGAAASLRRMFISTALQISPAALRRFVLFREKRSQASR
jgi:glycosyltransferase involved in cell wall biosynthesis